MKNHSLASLAKLVLSDRQYCRSLARAYRKPTRTLATIARAFDAAADQVELDGDPESLLAIITAPTLAGFAFEIEAIAHQCGRYVTRETPKDERFIDLRLYLHTAGYRLEWGDPQGDRDHRGYCGAATIEASERTSYKRARKVAAELLADALDGYTQQHDIPPAIKAWLDLTTKERTR